MLKIYLAHPITGLSPQEVFGYYDNLCEILHHKYQVFHPMLGKDYFRQLTDSTFVGSGYGNAVANNHSIVKRDYWMVQEADVVLMDLVGPSRVSIGCMFELAWAHQLHRHVVLVLESQSVHRHAFVLECADIVFETQAEALVYLDQLGA